MHVNFFVFVYYSNIYEDIKENSDKIWKYDKYDMIMEFKNKPALPMPLSIFANIPRIFFHLCKNEANKSYVQEGKGFQIVTLFANEYLLL